MVMCVTLCGIWCACIVTDGDVCVTVWCMVCVCGE